MEHIHDQYPCFIEHKARVLTIEERKQHIGWRPALANEPGFPVLANISFMNLYLLSIRQIPPHTFRSIFDCPFCRPVEQPDRSAGLTEQDKVVSAQNTGGQITCASDNRSKALIRQVPPRNFFLCQTKEVVM